MGLGKLKDLLLYVRRKRKKHGTLGQEGVLQQMFNMVVQYARLD